MQPAITLSYATYLVSGAVLTILGPLVPEITQHYQISYAMLGTAMVLNSLAYLPAVLLGGFFCSRYSARKVIAVGLLCMAAGYAAIFLADFWWLFIVGYCVGGGLGFGLAEAGLNAFVMEHAGKRQGAALNMLHVYAACGAVLGPALARILVATTGQWQVSYLILAVIYGIFAVVFMCYRLPCTTGHIQDVERLQLCAMAKAVYHPIIALLAIAMTFYVGAEIGLSSWMYSYIVTEVGGSTMLGASLNSLFWGGLGLGRFISAHLSEKIGYERFLCWSALFATVALAPALFWRESLIVTASFFCTGLLFAGSFPTILAIGAKATPGQSGPVAGMLIFFAGIGTMIFPPAMGYLADTLGIWHAMALAFYCVLALTASTAVLWWRSSAKRALPVHSSETDPATTGIR